MTATDPATLRDRAEQAFTEDLACTAEYAELTEPEQRTVRASYVLGWCFGHTAGCTDTLEAIRAGLADLFTR